MYHKSTTKVWYIETCGPCGPFWSTFLDFWKILPNCCLICSQILVAPMAVELLAVFKGRGALSKNFFYICHLHPKLYPRDKFHVCSICRSRVSNFDDVITFPLKSGARGRGFSAEFSKFYNFSYSTPQIWSTWQISSLGGHFEFLELPPGSTSFLLQWMYPFLPTHINIH